MFLFRPYELPNATSLLFINAFSSSIFLLNQSAIPWAIYKKEQLIIQQMQCPVGQMCDGTKPPQDPSFVTS